MLFRSPNIGSKALSEIKQALEKVVGHTSAPVVPAEPVVAPPAAAAVETPEEAQKLFIEAVGAADADVAPAAAADDAEVDEDGVPAVDDVRRLPRGKRDKKGKERALVFDEELGRMVPARTHRLGDEGEDFE